MNFGNLKNINGFTLVEMAMVLVIFSLLMGGILVPLQKQKDINAYLETQERIATIKEAILGYAVVNGKLPCPANPRLRTGIDVSAGVIDNTLCNGAGVAPWVDLELPETDAWGRRFSYRISSNFGDDISARTFQPPSTCNANPTSSSFALCSEGDIVVHGENQLAISKKLPVLIVSHGANGYGAYLSNGTQFQRVRASALELENVDDANRIFNALNINQEVFDDIVDWISPNILFNRMVAAGKLP